MGGSEAAEAALVPHELAAAVRALVEIFCHPRGPSEEELEIWHRTIVVAVEVFLWLLRARRWQATSFGSGRLRVSEVEGHSRFVRWHQLL